MSRCEVPRSSQPYGNCSFALFNRVVEELDFDLIDSQGVQMVAKAPSRVTLSRASRLYAKY
ncbi:MAG: hypothetical protein QOH81_2020 [Sphingomonadales bacterium]|jgi:hypothetical protein|nr:hypothetical protein [Sphingomonadales bacterium]